MDTRVLLASSMSTYSSTREYIRYSHTQEVKS